MFRCIGALRNFDVLLPLQQRAVKLPGWARAAPPSGYHSALPHAVELVHSEHTHTHTTIVKYRIVQWAEVMKITRELHVATKQTLWNNVTVCTCESCIYIRSHHCLDMRYLPSSIRRSIFLQQQVGDLDLPVLCSHMQRSEALLERHRTKEH